MSRQSVLSLLLLLSASAALAEDQPVDFERDVLPIFAARCHACHGPEKREGGLRLTGRAQLLHRNDSGEPAVAPGDSAASELIRRVTAAEDERMPPEGDPLTPEQVATLRRWIDAGADWPASAEVRPAHWAYVAPQRPALPPVSNPAWVRSEIDAFVLAKVDSLPQPLQPSAAAEPAKLLRRVHLDLIGLPPSVGDIDAFLADPSPEHYEQIVDRLLACPRYGEKWARQWLDLARYADSNGYQADQFRSVWAYRDWVIAALNADMPFDEFTLEQLAGDLLPGATDAQRIATGFHRCTTCNVEAGVDAEENRANQVIDRVNTTGTVWLGTTLECAQCHNHKYDPFTQQDYYQLFAFFNNTPLEVELPDGKGVQYEVAGPFLDLPMQADQRQRKEQLEERRARLQAQLAARREELQGEQVAWERALLDGAEQGPSWHTLDVTSFASTGGATHTILDDKSLLIGGRAPARDTYTITVETDLSGITGFKLECLTHESLPGGGPGRGDAERPNFVLKEFAVTRVSRIPPPCGVPNDPQPVPLTSGEADFSQKGWDVAGLIDGDPKTGWAINPQFGKPHWATFLTTEPVGFDGGTILTFSLPQDFGQARTIGRLRLSAMTGTPGASAVPDDVREALAGADAERTEAQRARLTAWHEEQDAKLGDLKKQLAATDRQLAQLKSDTTLVMVEQAQSRMTHIFKRGDFLQPGAQVDLTTPAVLHPLTAEHTHGDRPDRRALARWLVSRDNPLVARVTVNRWWAEFFGRGIVETLEDFGTQAEPPTHPELLDWLAVEFMDGGWSMKKLHKRIVMSATYQQDSRVTPQLLQRDPYNALYARGPRVRLAAETIRDNALAISGLLSTRMGGPPVYPPQPEGIWRHVGRNAPKYDTDTDEDRFRRGVYVVWRRSAPYPSFVNFDATDRASCVVERSRTNTPLQALTLLNDPAYVEMALGLARRLASELPDASDRERIEHGFRLAVSRAPASDDVQHLVGVLDQQRRRFEGDPQAASELVAGGERTESVSAAELAAWFHVANVLLNLDETISKN